MHNAFHMPTLQKWTYKWIGFPIPYLLVGRWLVSPLPKKVPLLYVVGEPIRPPRISAGKVLNSVCSLREDVSIQMIPTMSWN